VSESDLVARDARLRARAIWVKWRVLQVGPDQYAFLDRDSDLIRFPEHGTLTLAEAESSVSAREKTFSWF